MWQPVFLLFLFLVGCSAEDRQLDPLILEKSVDMVHLPAEAYSEFADFMGSALKETNHCECTLERKKAVKREEKEAEKLSPRPGYDRVAWPLSICKEGVKSTYVDYIHSAAKKKADQWFRKHLRTYPDGTKIVFYDIDDPYWIRPTASKGESGNMVITIGEPPKLKKRIVEEGEKEQP